MYQFQDLLFHSFNTVEALFLPVDGGSVGSFPLIINEQDVDAHVACLEISDGDILYSVIDAATSENLFESPYRRDVVNWLSERLAVYVVAKWFMNKQ